MATPPRKRKPRKANLPAAAARPRPRPATARTPAKAAPQPADSSTRATRVLNWLLRKLPTHRREKALDYLVLTRMDRPIGAGRVSPGEALVVFAILLVVAFGLVLLTNRLTIELAFGGAALAVLYPFSKRYTYLPQVVLGAAFGWSIPMAFAAVMNTVPPLGWLLFIGNILWSTIYDTEYAMVDREDDLKAGAKSTAILFGDADLPILGMLMGTFVLAMLFVGQHAQLGWPYWLALLVAAGLFAWQLWLIRHRARDACLAAFRHNNWLGLTLWVGIALALAVR